jgi:hypothetical protein
MGFPKNDTPGITPTCYIQGFLNFFFSRSTWLFTDILIIQLFSVIVYKRYILNVKYMHCIVWSLNIVLQILPLTKGDYYGQTIDSSTSSIPLERCYMGSKSFSKGNESNKLM